jgi:hypothetical protein
MTAEGRSIPLEIVRATEEGAESDKASEVQIFLEEPEGKPFV